MEFYFLFGTIYMSVIVYLTMGIFLFMRRKEGDILRYTLIYTFFLTSICSLNQFIHNISTNRIYTPSNSFIFWIYVLLPIAIFHMMYYFSKNNKARREWTIRYISIMLIPYLCYISAIATDEIWVFNLFYILSAISCMTMTYLELIIRIVCKETITTDDISQIEKSEYNMETKICNSLSNRIESFMQYHNAWQDAEFSLEIMAQTLGTNRTYVSSAIRELGYNSFNDYLNKHRIYAFINLMHSGEHKEQMDAFYAVGYRSRKTALKHFKKITGKTPSKYFE